MQHHPRTSSTPTIILAGDRVKNTVGATGFMSALENLTRNLPLLGIEDQWEAALAARRMHGFFEQLNNRFTSRRASSNNAHISDSELLLRIEDSSLPRDAYATLEQAQEVIYQAIQHDCPQLSIPRNRVTTLDKEVLADLYRKLPEAQQQRMDVLVCLTSVLNTISAHLPQMKSQSMGYEIGY